MSNELSVYEAKPLTKVDEKTIEDYLFTSDTKLNDKQKKLFLAMAVRNNLDPFKREVYAIAFGSNFNIITGYQTYIQRAESTGLLNGWGAETIRNQGGNITGARVTIYRKDWDKPFIWETSMSEFNKGMSQWKTMPEFMIKKVCIAQGFRLAFPNELGGMPYIREEIEAEEAQTEDKTQYQMKPPEEKQDMVSDNQKKAISAICNKLGIKDDKVKHNYIGMEILGMAEGIKSINDLTKAQATTVIKYLNEKREAKTAMEE